MTPDEHLAHFLSEWDRCAPWIAEALKYGGDSHNLDDVKKLILTGEAQFWSSERSAVVTEIQTWPRARFLLFWLAGGDLDELSNELRPKIEAFAKQHGCSRTVIFGRRGWSRALPGYEAVAWSIAKDL